ncbi:hypothetical protein D1007_29147 [Hordeum vulgare]|nr:hypothetical protein D1007_29147 [Hordeum vulgare]
MEVQPPAPTVEAAATPEDVNIDAMASPSALRMPDAGENPEPPMPQVEGMRATLVTVAGNVGVAAPRWALALVGEDTLLNRAPLTNALDMIAQLEVDFWDAEMRVTMERVRLATGWRPLDASAKEAQGEAKAIRAGGGRWEAARPSALAEKEALPKRCEELEASFKVLQEAFKAHEAKHAYCESEQAKAATEEAAEHRRLEALQREVDESRDARAKQVSEANAKLATREEEIEVAAKAKAAADRVALSSVELRACQALSSICRLDLESPFVPQDASYAEFSSELMKEVEGRANKVDGILGEECCKLFSVATTCDFSHLLLRDPRFTFEKVMGPVPEESRGDLVAAMEGHVNTLLGQLFCSDGEEPDEEAPTLVLK